MGLLGGIELSIFSEIYQVEIIAVDIQNIRLDRFGMCQTISKVQNRLWSSLHRRIFIGEDRHYKNRVMVIYNGIHYDALVLSPYPGAPNESDITLFSSEDDAILAQALAIAEEARQVYNNII
jgi:ubiquitin thioesterase OTU1